MNILIKGMVMPKNCVICPFMKTNDDLESDDYRFRYCDFPFIGEFVTDYEKSRHPACPLIELLPHGRLIDADALHIDLIDRGIADIQTNDWCEIRQAVDDAPTIIEADDSIKRAEWEKHNDGIMYWWECSKCHHDAWYDGDDLYNYCPWCGAKMTIIESEEEDG